MNEFDSIVGGAREAFARAATPADLENAKAQFVGKSGRITELMESGRMQRDLGLPEINPATDRAMICGSPPMLADFRRLLDGRGLVASAKIGQAGHYVFERAFVEK